MQKYAWAAIGLGIIIIVGALYLFQKPETTLTVDQLPIIDGSQQGQPTYTNATPNDIVVTNPFPGAVTGKEVVVIGKARGPWYFEASFPVVLLDKNGNVLAQGPAQAEGEWMTEEFVPFKVSLMAPESYIGPATLILKNDNPSGEPERDKSVSFPITIEY